MRDPGKEVEISELDPKIFRPDIDNFWLIKHENITNSLECERYPIFCRVKIP